MGRPISAELHARAHGPREAIDWKAVALEVKRGFDHHNIAIVAAGVTFFLLLSLFPALFAALSLYGYVSDASSLERQIAQITWLLPDSARALVMNAMRHILAQPMKDLSIGAVAGLVATVWSARKGMNALIKALNIINGVEKGRGFVRRNLASLGFTLGAIAVLVVAATLVAVWPALVNLVPLTEAVQTGITFLRWPFLLLLLIGALVVLYRYGPWRPTPPWRDVAWGALAATIVWITASVALSWYMANYANMNRTFGAVAGVAMLMLWLYVTTLVILGGAELNHALEAKQGSST